MGRNERIVSKTKRVGGKAFRYHFMHHTKRGARGHAKRLQRSGLCKEYRIVKGRTTYRQHPYSLKARVGRHTVYRIYIRGRR